MFWKSALLISLTAGFSYASLDTLTFSYDVTDTGPLFSGTMSGTLLGDLNTFVVDSVGPITYGGLPGSAPFAFSLDNLIDDSLGAVPTVTLDGSYMDLVACSAKVGCPNAFAFAVGDLFATFVVKTPFFFFGDLGDDDGDGGTALPFDAANWSASVTPNVAPEPGYALPVLIIGAFTLVLGRKKKRRGVIA